MTSKKTVSLAVLVDQNYIAALNIEIVLWFHFFLVVIRSPHPLSRDKIWINLHHLSERVIIQSDQMPRILRLLSQLPHVL